MALKPFSLLVKPASADCNLRCQYCFYLKKCELYPDAAAHRMTDEVLETIVSSYLDTEQPVYSFGWQGGEPALMGLDFFKRANDLQQMHGKGSARIANGFQTNGTLVDDAFAAYLSGNKYLVGLSLDGPGEIHDLFRRTANGRGTHSDMVKCVERFQRNNVEFNVLTMVTSESVKRGGEIYDYLCEMGIFHHQYIPCVEFDEKGEPMPFSISGEEWGDFLCEVFDKWSTGDARRVSVRLFDGIVDFMVEREYFLCHMGGNCCQYFVVEYNGDVYPCDFFVDKDSKLGNIMYNSWEEMQSSASYHEFGKQKNQWNSQCSRCPYLAYCSGDCLKHRLCGVGEPTRKSWLCSGWKKFYGHSLPRFKELAYASLEDGGTGGKNARTRNTDLITDMKIGRNVPCFCGSLKKYKKCHGGAC